MTNLMLVFEETGRYLLTWTVQVAVLVLFIQCVVRLDLKHRPALRFRIWALAVGCILMLPWLPSMVAAAPWMTELKQTWVDQGVRSSATFSIENQLMRKTSVEAEVRRTKPSAMPVSGIATGFRFHTGILFQLVGGLWLFGFAFSAFRRLKVDAHLRTVLRRAQLVSLERLTSAETEWRWTRAPAVFLSSEVSGPMLYGWFRPVILLPGDVLGWSTLEERVAMLRHECVHHRRKDHWIAGLELVVRTALFFHPLAHLACRQIDIERELACDEEVLRLGSDAKSYADTILKVAEHALGSRMSYGGVSFASAAQVGHRIDLLFRRRPDVRRTVLVVLPVLLLLIPVVTFGFWQVSAENAMPIELAPSRVMAAVHPEAFLPRLAPANPRPRVRLQNPQIQGAAAELPRFDTRIDNLRGPGLSHITRVSLQIPFEGLDFREEQGILRAAGQIEGTITDLTGRIVNRIQDPFAIDAPARSFKADGWAVFHEDLTLPPGLYRLSLSMEDSRSGNKSTMVRRLEVVRSPEGSLWASTLILADLIETLPVEAPARQFQIGALRVRPNVKNQFRRDQTLNTFLQIYGLKLDPGGQASVATIKTVIMLSGREVRSAVENFQASKDITITKSFPLADFDAGEYSIHVTITDAQTGQSIESVAQFTVQ